MVLNFLRILYTYRQEFDGIMHNKPAWPNQILEYRRKKECFTTVLPFLQGQLVIFCISEHIGVSTGKI